MEVSDAMQTYSPSEEMKKKYAEEARLAALEAKRFRDEVLRRMQDDFERKKREEMEKEAEKKRKLEEHYRYCIILWLCYSIPVLYGYGTFSGKCTSAHLI